jgi:TATA-box binding protein (TBP) (component of TFIID and TFIIIB)
MSIVHKINELNVQFETFPKKLKITTATITCKVKNVIFNIENIGLYFNEFDDVLVSKKYGNRKEKKTDIIEINNFDFVENTVNNEGKIHIINNNNDNDNDNDDKQNNKINIVNKKEKIKKIKIKKESKKEKKRGNNFYNQVSLIFNTAKLMEIDENKLSKKDKEKNINVKLFINGSIHMTGCKHFSNITRVLEIIFSKITKVKSIYDKEKKCFKTIRFVNSYNPEEVEQKKELYQFNNKKIHQDKFLTKIYEELTLGIIDELTLNNVKKFKIGMINTNFNIGFKINREALCEKMAENNISVNFESISHASVDSKIYINYLDKKISIFVFESGSITIAGSKSYDQIKYGFEFINKFILEHYYDLYVKPITPQVLIKIIENMKK